MKPAQKYRVSARKDTKITFDYTRPVVGRSKSGKDIVYPLEVDDEVVRFPLLIEDGFRSQFVDVPLRVAPVTINWKSQQYAGIANQIKVDWEFVSGSEKIVKGTYRIGMGGGMDQPRSFTVSPLGRLNATSNLRFRAPKNVDCFQNDIFIELTIAGQTYRFTRELEASRDLVLGEKRLMASGADYIIAPAGKKEVSTDKWAPTIYFDAVVDKSTKAGLYSVIDLSGLKIPDLGKNAAVRAVLSVDARPMGKVRDFGAINPIVIYFKGTGGKGYIPNLPLGTFGDGYNMQLDPSGIGSVLKNNQIQVKIPLSYMHLHDWKIEGNSFIGVKMEVSIADPATPQNPFSLGRTFTTNSPNLFYKGEYIRGITANDARGLTTLRLSRRPVDSWSVSVY